MSDEYKPYKPKREIVYRIGSDTAKGEVIIDFENFPGEVIFMSPDIARTMAAHLIKHAQRIDGK